MLGATGGKPVLEAGPQDFGDPHLDEIGRECRYANTHGCGAV